MIFTHCCHIVTMKISVFIDPLYWYKGLRPNMEM